MDNPVITLPEPYEVAGIKVIPIISTSQFPRRCFEYPKCNYPTPDAAAAQNQRVHGWRPTEVYDFTPKSGKFGRWVVEA